LHFCSEIDVNDMTESEQAMLSEWVLSAFDAAVHAGYISPPRHPTGDQREMMRGYYVSGLTPAEGAEAMFATRQ
jgi:hypothetical protein